MDIRHRRYEMYVIMRKSISGSEHEINIVPANNISLIEKLKSQNYLCENIPEKGTKINIKFEINDQEFCKEKDTVFQIQ